MWKLGPKPEIDPERDIRRRVVGYVGFPKGVWLSSSPVSQPARAPFGTARSGVRSAG